MRDDDDDVVMTAKEFSEKAGRFFENSTLNLPDGVKRFKLDSNKTRYIDLIPYKVGEGNKLADPGTTHYVREYFVHKGLGADGKNRELCQQNFGKACWICNHLNQLKSSGEIDEDQFKKCMPKMEQLFNVIDVEDRAAGIQVWSVPEFYFGRALKTACQALDDDEPEQHFASYKKGFTLKLTVEEQKQGKISMGFKVTRVDFKKRKKQPGKSILKEAHCLDDLLKRKTTKELKKTFMQFSDEGDDDDSRSNSSKKKDKKMAKAKVTFAKGDEVEWDEVEGTCVVVSVSKDGKYATIKDEEDEKHSKVPVKELTKVESDDDDDEDEKPSKKSKSKKTAKKSSKKSKKDDDDDDDDDDDESDDDDDESDDDDDDDESDDDDDDDESDDDDDDDDDESDDDDDESDDDDDDDDDEDEKPSKKSKSKKTAKKPAKKKSRK